MSLVSLKEFASLAGVSYDVVKQTIRRKKIIKGDNNLIDTENAINKLFLDSNKSKSVTKPTKKEAVSKEKKAIEMPTGLTAAQKIYNDLDLRTRIATAEVKERESELKRIQLEKVAGNLLPVDLCEKIISINIQAVFKGFESEMENMASIYNEEFGGDRKTLVNIIRKQREVFARAISKASKDAKYELENAVNDFQDAKTRGQR